MMNFRDKETRYTGKQEVGDSTKATTAAAASSSRQWSGFKNPRIVRVSRTFGGKDRHSKVCTIKGLRDRRIRLSVPTAIQLYDLQDRLGLSQPSKVIDWLLDTTKDDIDNLPPLPMIPGTYSPFHQASQGYGAPQSSSTPFFDANLLPLRKEGININDSQTMEVDEENQSLGAKLKYWDKDDQARNIRDNASNSQISAQNFFPVASSSSSSMIPPSSLLNNNPMFNYYHWEPSNLSLAQLGSLGSLPNSQDDHPQSNLSLSSSSGSQLFLYPSMGTTSFYPPNASFLNTFHQVENDFRQSSNRFHLSNSLSSSLQNSSGSGWKPFPLSMNQPHLHHNDDDHQGKGDHHGH